jgi:hypothetical protein
MTSSVLLIGNGDAYEMAREICRGDGRNHLMEISSSNGFDYDLAFLDEFDPQKYACAVALDSHAVNFPRMTLLLRVSEKGFRFASLISRYSSVHETAKVQKGVILGPNSVVSAGVSIAYGATIHAGVVLGRGSAIKAHVSILDGALVGVGCKVGLGTTIGRGAVLSDGASVGRHCELLRPEVYSGEIKDRTYQDALFTAGMVIHDFR